MDEFLFYHSAKSALLVLKGLKIIGTTSKQCYKTNKTNMYNGLRTSNHHKLQRYINTIKWQDLLLFGQIGK
jgi:hypothetical protein